MVAGGITVQQNATRTQVNQAEQRGIVDWRSFNVGSDHQVQFQQPSSSAVTLNRVTTPDPSVIAGRISANGQLVIVNQSGVVFSQGSQVDAAGLVVSAAGITNQNFMAGRMVFDQPARPGARVENNGRITIREAGLAALVAPQVANRGTITARLGRVALAGAETHAVDLYGDGMLSVEVTGKVRQAPNGGTALVTNSGVIEARGGTVQLTAEAVDGIVQDLVRVGGRVSANTDATTGRTGRVMIAGAGGAVRIEGQVRTAGLAPGTRGGTVEVLGDRVRVEATGRIDASGTAGGGEIALGTPRGDAPQPRLARRASTAPGAVLRADATQRGQGGTVRINSAEYTEHAGEISARGGPQGGDGGFVEVSGQQGLRTPGRIDASAPAGQPGTILFDPINLEIVLQGTTPLPPSGIVDPNVPQPPANATISASQISSFSGNVQLSATQDIFVRVPLTAGSTSGSLTMTAGRDLQVDAPIDNFRGLVLAAQSGDLRLNAPLAGNGTTILTAGRALTVSDTASSISATSLQASAGGNVNLGSAGSTFSSILLSGGPATISAGQDAFVRTPLVSGPSAGPLTIRADRNVQVDAPVSGFNGLTLAAATGDLRLTAPLSDNGGTALTAGATLRVDSPVQRSQGLSLSAMGDVRVNAGLDAGTAALTISAGGRVLSEPLGPAAFVASRVSIAAGGSVELGNASIPRGPLTIYAGTTAISAAGDLRIDMPLLGSSVSGNLSAGPLSLAARGKLTIGEPVQGFQGLDVSAAGDARLDAGLDAGRSALTISAGGRVLSEPLRPIVFLADRISIVAGTSVELGNASVSRGPLLLSAGASTVLSAGSDLRIDMPLSSRSSETLAMNAVGNLTVAQAVSAAGSVRLQAGSNLAVSSAGGVTSGGDLLLTAQQVTAAGLMAAGGAITIQASAASLAGRATAPAGGFTVAAPQITFGGLAAGDTPVTLALGTAGTATGTLEVGSLLVQGGAGAVLSGSIAGIADGTAAALGRRASPAGVPLAEPLPQPERFTFNACPIGVLVCAPPVMPLVVPPRPLVPLITNPRAVIAVLDPANLVTNAARLRSPEPLAQMHIARDRSEEEELAPPDVRRDDY